MRASRSLLERPGAFLEVAPNEFVARLATYPVTGTELGERESLAKVVGDELRLLVHRRGLTPWHRAPSCSARSLVKLSPMSPDYTVKHVPGPYLDRALTSRSSGPAASVAGGYPRRFAPRRPLNANVRTHITMSRAKATFESSIGDAEALLTYFDAINKQPPPENAEVLKRAGLIMALTAWETYVEDRVREEMHRRLQVVDGSYVGKFVLTRLEEELRRFHNPSSEKTKKLFHDYLGIDVTTAWTWQHFDLAKVKKTLDDLIVKRGDAVHRSKPAQSNTPPPHLVKREDLERAIRFLKSLVEATDRALVEQ